MHGKIYKIEFPDGYFYYGSSVQPLSARLQAHKRQRMSQIHANIKSGYLPRTRFDIYLTKNDWNNPTIQCVQECEVVTRQELNTIEKGYVIAHANDSKILNDCWLPPTEMQKLCHLEGQLNSKQEQWREIWIKNILDNWFLSPYITTCHSLPCSF